VVKQRVVSGRSGHGSGCRNRLQQVQRFFGHRSRAGVKFCEKQVQDRKPSFVFGNNSGSLQSKSSSTLIYEAEVAGVTFSDSVPVPQFMNPCPPPVRQFFKFENATPVQTPATNIDQTTCRILPERSGSGATSPVKWKRSGSGTGNQFQAPVQLHASEDFWLLLR